jgi:hypothetical protein
MLHFPSLEGIPLRGDLAMTGVLNLFAPANNFQDRCEPVVGRVFRRIRQTCRFIQFGETVSVVLSGVTLLQREALEASPGGASTVTGGGRRLHYLDSAQRAVQSKGDSRKPTEPSANAQRNLVLRKAMWPRETTARSGDIEGGVGSPPAKPMSSGFAAGHRRLCRSEKHEVFGCPHVWLRSRRLADSERQCDVAHERSDVGERCGRA